MKLKNTFLFIFVSFFYNIQAQDYFPGGVTGAEAWYIVDYDDLTQQVFPNHALNYIKISNNGDIGPKNLFNFNHSFTTDGLWLTYNTSLENTTSRNLFFVGEVDDTEPNYSHFTTSWNPLIQNLPQVDDNTPIRNRFDAATKRTYVDSVAAQYQSVNNANVNFYNWNIYQTDRRFKSYGPEGETSFHIGKGFYNNIVNVQADYFKGNFPEFISFPFELAANEKNRVESYLALKYGITLKSPTSYRDSENLVFWKAANGNIFPNRIFGVGHDKISNQNQLQSESVHKKDYLVASIYELAQTNKDKQGQVSIEDHHFIVFGDNLAEGDGLIGENDFHVEPLKRVWLSQNTGIKALYWPMYFKLNIIGVLQDRLNEDPNLKLWMLHDRYMDNTEVSDFNSNYVEYYPASMDGPDYAYFKEVFFDTDSGVFDQFTFGVGPEMIVQVRFSTTACDATEVETDIVITGGQAPYDIYIYGPNGIENYSTYENIYTFNAHTSYEYTIVVYDVNGVMAENTIDISVPSPPLVVDLGPDVILTAANPQATLDATAYTNDPNLTYQWYKNGQLLEDEHGPVLTVGQPGEYSVVIIAGNRICEVTDSILVYYNYIGNVQAGFDCEDPYGSITLSITGGVPPYTTLITGAGQTINQVHNSENFVFNQVNFGNHTVKTTDINGEVYEQNVYVQDPLQWMELDLLSQLEQICTITYYDYLPYPLADCYTDFTLDASALVSNPNVMYEWFLNGQPLYIYTPQIHIVHNEGGDGGIKEYMVKITNVNTGCFLTETFGIKGPWMPQDAMAETSKGQDSQDESNREKAGYVTKVYPNPSNPNETFYYEITSTEVFDGIVQIYSPTGALVLQEQISGQSAYTLPFNLLQAGVYFVCTKTNGNIITDKIIIR